MPINPTTISSGPNPCRRSQRTSVSPTLLLQAEGRSSAATTPFRAAQSYSKCEAQPLLDWLRRQLMWWALVVITAHTMFRILSQSMFDMVLRSMIHLPLM